MYVTIIDEHTNINIFVYEEILQSLKIILLYTY